MDRHADRRASELATDLSVIAIAVAADSVASGCVVIQDVGWDESDRWSGAEHLLLLSCSLSSLLK